MEYLRIPLNGVVTPPVADRRLHAQRLWLAALTGAVSVFAVMFAAIWLVGRLMLGSHRAWSPTGLGLAVALGVVGAIVGVVRAAWRATYRRWRSCMRSTYQAAGREAATWSWSVRSARWIDGGWSIECVCLYNKTVYEFWASGRPETILWKGLGDGGLQFGNVSWTEPRDRRQGGELVFGGKLTIWLREPTTAFIHPWWRD